MTARPWRLWKHESPGIASTGRHDGSMRVDGTFSDVFRARTIAYEWVHDGPRRTVEVSHAATGDRAYAAHSDSWGVVTEFVDDPERAEEAS